MNTNDEKTMAMQPNQNGNNNSRNQRPATNVKPEAEQTNDHLAAKVAAGIAAGVAAGAATAAAAPSVIDKLSGSHEDVDETPETPTPDPTPDPEPEPEPAPAPAPKPEPEPAPKPEPKPDPDPDPDAEVHFIGVDVVDVDGDGSYEVVGAMTIDDEGVLVVDVDVDGYFDIAILDANHDGIIDEQEIVDISSAGLRIDEFVAQVLEENPEGAEGFLAALDDPEVILDDEIDVSDDHYDGLPDEDYIEVDAPAADAVDDGTFFVALDDAAATPDNEFEVAMVDMPEDDAAPEQDLYAASFQADIDPNDTGNDSVHEEDPLLAVNDMNDEFDAAADDFGSDDILIDC